MKRRHLLKVLARWCPGVENTDERNARLWGITTDARGGYTLPRRVSEEIALAIPARRMMEERLMSISQRRSDIVIHPCDAMIRMQRNLVDSGFYETEIIQRQLYPNGPQVWHLVVNSEYAVPILFCPFCGVSLSPDLPPSAWDNCDDKSEQRSI